jgi:hypothetical protein
MQPSFFVGDKKEIIVTPVISKPITPFIVSIRLKNFLTYLKLELEKPDPYDGMLTSAQHDAIPRQRQKLILTLKQNGVLPEYRKFVLSAMLGKDIVTQKELSWRTHSCILDALKQEKDNGKMVLEEIQNGLIAHPASLPGGLYSFLWECSDMSRL